MTQFELLAASSSSDTHTAVVVEYLDLDGDGVPDAVHIRRVECGADGVTPVRVVDEMAIAIGIDGVARDVELRESAA